MHAQLINPGFETWTNDMLVPTAMNPNSGNATTGWCDYNYFNSSFLGSSPISVTRCTDTVHSGSYAVRLQTKAYTATSWNYYNSWGIPFIGHAYNDTLGILFNGNVNVSNQSYTPGIPFTQKISQFNIYYQYKPNGTDTAVFRALLVNHRNPVGGGIFKTHTATGSSGWQLATVNFTYVSTATPDTLWVLISSSSLDKNPKAGSILWLDDASVALSTGLHEMIGEEQNVDIFPNPSNGVFTLQSLAKSDKEQLIEVYTVLGKKMYSSFHKGMEPFEMDLSHYPKGIYYVRCYSGDNTSFPVGTKKIVIQ
ncbi:MAG: T9SS type A sorting domain-containing protein, partial [Bacteroidetes bacterium]|nr:T9SS type A sorting domain-containing protein [Bacteroidota bacterium]